jgi:CheY-like chemotaxis protein
MKLDIVMVDDEEALVWSTGQRLMRERPRVAFEGFTDPQAALARIQTQAPDLLITDVRMPGISGLELTLAARMVRPALPVLVITAYGGPEVLEVARAPNTEYLEKPFSFVRLLAAIDRMLAQRTGFSGAVSLPLLPDLIQIYTLSMATGALRIARAGREGTIWFEHGEMVHAELAEAKGEPAVQQLLAWKGGSFALDPQLTAPERTIHASWQTVLLEACRLLDEGGTEASEEPEGPARDWSGVPQRLGWPPLDELSRALPAATILVADLASATAVALQGWPAPPELASLVRLTRSQILRISPASRGSLEWAAAGRCGVLAWEAEVAMVVAERVSGAVDAARFRSHVIRAIQGRNER